MSSCALAVSASASASNCVDSALARRARTFASTSDCAGRSWFTMGQL